MKSLRSLVPYLGWVINPQTENPTMVKEALKNALEICQMIEVSGRGYQNVIQVVQSG